MRIDKKFNNDNENPKLVEAGEPADVRETFVCTLNNVQATTVVNGCTAPISFRSNLRPHYLSVGKLYKSSQQLDHQLVSFTMIYLNKRLWLKKQV